MSDFIKQQQGDVTRGEQKGTTANQAASPWREGQRAKEKKKEKEMKEKSTRGSGRRREERGVKKKWRRNVREETVAKDKKEEGIEKNK